MKNLNFKYFSAKNFLCFGPEGIEIDLTKMGRIVLVRGENLDVIDEEEKEGDERVASNGIGKSSIPEILIYTFFGKTIKKIKKNENIINNQVGKDLRTEVRWDKYRVVRTRNPTGLRMWESEEGVWDKDTEITLGGMKDTEQLIIDKLGLNYQTCLNLLVFADQSVCTFLECDGPDKRTVVEDLMSLQEYRAYMEWAKDEKNTFKNQIKVLSATYEQSLAEVRSAKDRVVKIQTEEKNWAATRKNELAGLKQKLLLKQGALKTSDIGPKLKEYEDAQAKIAQLNDDIPELERQVAKNQETIGQIEEKIDQRKKEKNELDQQVMTLENENLGLKNDIKAKEKILKVRDKSGQTCTECYSTISEENFGLAVGNAEKAIAENKRKLLLAEASLSELATKRADVASKLQKANQLLVQARTGLSTLQSKVDNARKELKKLMGIEKPKANEQEKVLLTEIAEVEKQIEAKQQEIDGPTPYASLYEQAEKDIVEKEKESLDKKKSLEVAEADLPYYEWWVNGFSPKGIPKWAINDVIPTLNKQVAHWLEFLIDGKIKLTFNNELDETIERNPSDGDPFVYYAMSGGEKRRLNLAVSQAFAYIMAHSSKASPSIVFLDEVTTNIDQMGVVGVYNMILELAKEKQVFVTTHDQGLLELLQGCETLYLRKKGGFTKIV